MRAFDQGNGMVVLTMWWQFVGFAKHVVVLAEHCLNAGWQLVDGLDGRWLSVNKSHVPDFVAGLPLVELLRFDCLQRLNVIVLKHLAA